MPVGDILRSELDPGKLAAGGFVGATIALRSAVNIANNAVGHFEMAPNVAVGLGLSKAIGEAATVVGAPVALATLAATGVPAAISEACGFIKIALSTAVTGLDLFIALAAGAGVLLFDNDEEWWSLGCAFLANVGGDAGPRSRSAGRRRLRVTRRSPPAWRRSPRRGWPPSRRAWPSALPPGAQSARARRRRRRASNARARSARSGERPDRRRDRDRRELHSRRRRRHRGGQRAGAVTGATKNFAISGTTALVLMLWRAPGISISSASGSTAPSAFEPSRSGSGLLPP